MNPYLGLFSCGLDPLYYQQQQQQQYQNLLNLNKWGNGLTAGATGTTNAGAIFNYICAPSPTAPKALGPTECDEFQWLRKRVNDILWH